MLIPYDSILFHRLIRLTYVNICVLVVNIGEPFPPSPTDFRGTNRVAMEVHQGTEFIPTPKHSNVESVC